MKRSPTLDAIVDRPVKHLATTGAHFPQFWRDHDQMRAEHKKLVVWPKWCFAPLTVAQKCFELPQYGGLSPSIEEEGGNLVAMSALAAWRLTKGIYLFDATMFDALWATGLEGSLPVELLQRLPEWCVYVPFPTPRQMTHIVLDRSNPAFAIYGFFAHLDWGQTGGTWLHLCLDTSYDDPIPFALNPITLQLKGDLSDCCRPFRDLLLNVARDFPTLEPAVTSWAKKQETDLIRPLVSILLWLCSANPEISGLDPLRGLKTKKTKKGIRTFGPDQPRVYEVAYRIGAALRLDREAIARGVPGGGSHTSPRPHIRRAHWHSYWTGPRAVPAKEQPTERKLILKWIAPIAVCAGTDDPIIPTVHPVLGEANATLAG